MSCAGVAREGRRRADAREARTRLMAAMVSRAVSDGRVDAVGLVSPEPKERAARSATVPIRLGPLVSRCPGVQVDSAVRADV